MVERSPTLITGGQKASLCAAEVAQVGIVFPVGSLGTHWSGEIPEQEFLFSLTDSANSSGGKGVSIFVT